MYGHEISEEEMNKIMVELESLCKQAEDNKQWLYNSYTDIWLSPNELRQNNREDSFLWGPPNWELRNPYEKLNEYAAQIRNIEGAKLAFNERIKNSGL